MADDLLFVYGSLRTYVRNSKNYLLNGCRLLDRGYVQGKLYQIANYPGLVMSHDASDHVYGELYKLPRPTITLAILDHYEGCGRNNSRPFEFVRKISRVTASDGHQHSAWVYYYNWPTSRLRKIKGGRYRKAFTG